MILRVIHFWLGEWDNYWLLLLLLIIIIIGILFLLKNIVPLVHLVLGTDYVMLQQTGPWLVMSEIYLFYINVAAYIHSAPGLI